LLLPRSNWKWLKMTKKKQIDFVKIDLPLVKRLVADQFPQWAHLTIEPVKISGRDNRTFHLGDQMSIRLPSGRWYAAHVQTEQIWLPKLALHLPLPVPVPLGMGRPASEYPWHWSINQWIKGENATVERINNLDQFAGDLADFLNILRSIDASGAPPPGKENFFRGGDLSVYDAQIRECFDGLQDDIDVEAVAAVWESALGAKWSGPAEWLHGDVGADNLLVNEGRLSAVIDFGQLAAGDPACDVTIAWTFFSGTSREVFFKRLSVDNATWLRGRGWAVWKAMLVFRANRYSDPFESARAKQVIEDVLSD
tara:strand:+ start:6894 stop:7823 length:930 start_codon:yes stop_codon:yes gene_type:complete